MLRCWLLKVLEKHKHANTTALVNFKDDFQKMRSLLAQCFEYCKATGQMKWFWIGKREDELQRASVSDYLSQEGNKDHDDRVQHLEWKQANTEAIHIFYKDPQCNKENVRLRGLFCCGQKST